MDQHRNFVNRPKPPGVRNRWLPPDDSSRSFPTGVRLARGALLVALLLVCGPLGTTQAQNQPQQIPQLGVAVQLPTFGVTIDGNGLLEVATVEDPSGKLRAERAKAARAGLRGNVARRSTQRKISLRRLEQAIARALAAGAPLDDSIRYLAGLKRVEKVFLYPDSHDIVLAGPAGGWLQDATGRVVGIDDNAPLVLLDDLVIALRALGPRAPRNQVVLCSIDPAAEGLKRFQGIHRLMPQQFTPAEHEPLADFLNARAAELLGPARIWIHGVPADCHLAQVMVESDYRMKLIAIGREPPPVDMITFAEAVDRPIRDFQQWWLTPDYHWVVEDAQAESMQLIGQGVQLITNRVLLRPDGSLEIQEQRSSRAAKTYAREFTDKYPAIAAASPVFAQLRNIVDVLIASAWLQRHDAWSRVDWAGGVLVDAERFPHQALPVPRTAPSVANALFKGEMLVLPAGGGFSINPSIALEPEYLTADSDGQLAELRQQQHFPADELVWWWD